MFARTAYIHSTVWEDNIEKGYVKHVISFYDSFLLLYWKWRYEAEQSDKRANELADFANLANAVNMCQI